MDSRLLTPFRTLRIALGLTATLAGLDKFFNLLADWPSYISGPAAHLLQGTIGIRTFMGAVGIIEMAVGALVLGLAPRIGAYVASAWLLLVSLNLIVGGHFDVAIRDLVLSIAAFTLARELEVEATSPERAITSAPRTHTITA